MKYYARMPLRSDRNAILEKFKQMGIPEEDVMLDAEKQQKQPSSAYTRLKQKLDQSKEPLCIDSLFSLGKNAREISKEIGWFRDHGISLCILDIPASIKDSNDKMDLLYEVNRIYAQREIDNLKMGQKASSKEKNRDNGILGRPALPYPKNWDELFEKYENHKITAAEFIEQTGLNRSTFYNMVRRYLQERNQAERNNDNEKRA